MNRVKIIIIVVVVVLILILFFVFSLLTRQNKPLAPNQTITPTSVQFDQTKLFITSIQPTDRTSTYSPAQPIEVTFTQPVEETSIRYKITPSTEVLINPGASGNSIIISPLTVWTIGETTISILPQTLSTSGNPLQNPQEYLLKAAIPTLPEHSDEAY